MASMRSEARSSNSSKLERMGLRLGGDPSPTSIGERGSKVKTADLDYPTGKGFHLPASPTGRDGIAPNGYADAFKTPAAINAYATNSNRPHRARGGAVKRGTTVNVIVAPQGGGGEPPAPPPMPPPGPPPMMAGPGGPPPGGPMMHARGGRVGRADGGRVSLSKTSGGAGGGKGRLAKIKLYGDRADDGPTGRTGKR